jgi:hypothetical protein
MRDPKEKPKGIEEKGKNDEQSYEISQTGYGLESVSEGCDFAEGDQNHTPPTCGGL